MWFISFLFCSTITHLSELFNLFLFPSISNILYLWNLSSAHVQTPSTWNFISKLRCPCDTFISNPVRPAPSQSHLCHLRFCSLSFTPSLSPNYSSRRLTLLFLNYSIHWYHTSVPNLFHFCHFSNSSVHPSEWLTQIFHLIQSIIHVFTPLLIFRSFLSR